MIILWTELEEAEEIEAPEPMTPAKANATPDEEDLPETYANYSSLKSTVDNQSREITSLKEQVQLFIFCRSPSKQSSFSSVVAIKASSQDRICRCLPGHYGTSFKLWDWECIQCCLTWRWKPWKTDSMPWKEKNLRQKGRVQLQQASLHADIRISGICSKKA